MNGFILTFLALFTVINGKDVASSTECSIQFNTTKSSIGTNDISAISSTAVTDNSDARPTTMLLRLTNIAIGAVVAFGFICAYLVRRRLNSDIVHPDPQHIVSDSVSQEEGNTQKQLRLACTQAILSACLFKGIHWLIDDDHSTIRDEYLPLFRAMSSEVKSELSDRSIADQLVRRYPNLPVLDTESSDEVKKIIEELLNDKELANAVTDVMKSNEIFYKVVMARHGTLEERRDDKFLQKALEEQGEKPKGVIRMNFYDSAKKECIILEQRIEQLFKSLFKQEAVKQNMPEHGGHEQPLCRDDAGDLIFIVMRNYYGSDLDFDQADDTKKRVSLFQCRSDLQ